MVKCYAQEKRVFDINKVTVVGSPTITSDGVMQINTSKVGVQFKDLLQTAWNDFTNYEIEFEFISKLGYPEWGKWYSVFNIGTFKAYGAGTETAPQIGFFLAGLGYIHYLNIQEDYLYNIKLVVNGSNVKYVARKNGEIIKEYTNNEYVPETQTASGTCYIHAFSDINLPSIKIYVDGELVYSPTKPTYYLERRKEGFDLSKFTVVGSPTITSDGVASGFTASDYVEIPSSINFTSDWELKFSFICTNTLVNERIVGSSISGNARLGINIGFTGAVNEENKLMCWLSSGTLSTDAWDIIGRKASTTTFQTNQLYYIILQCKNGVYTLKSSTDRINWVTEWTINNSLITGSKSLSIGFPVAEPVLYPFAGSIDLPSFSITVDGKEVFTGAKEKFYAMRGM